VITSLVGDVQQLAKGISDLLVEEAGASPPADRERLVRDLRRQRIDKERELNRALGLRTGLDAPAPAEVLGVIPEDAVVLDFFVGSRVYVWVLRHDREPELLTLGAPEALREMQAAFLRRRVVRGGAVSPEDDGGAAFAERLWGPLREAVGTARTVVVCPDGFLCELAFGVLPAGEGRFLLEEHRFVYVSDTTRLVDDLPALDDREGSVLAVGDVNYFRRGKPEGSLLASNVRSRIGDTWTPLDGTREELAALRGLYEGALDWEAPFTQLDGEDATEDAVREALPGKRYLHLATHGYFEPDALPSILRRGDERFTLRVELNEVTGMLPGLLSGLVFAGVNAPPEPGRDDGYLSAEEVALVDLADCDLAVLSACNTALGSERAGHGLMSLRRAFEVAGARTVVSSLWKVDDRAAATLMKHFYENYWVAGMGKAEALHEAKLRMLRQNRTDYGGDARPQTWGAFVLSGDWQ
jgi:CHAT domain-containing protein